MTSKLHVLAFEAALTLAGGAQAGSDTTHGGGHGANVTPIEFDYRLSPLDLVNNGHTIQQNYVPGSAITVGGSSACLHFVTLL